MAFTRRERIEKTITGEATDRVPVALWRHWPGDDQRPPDLVESAIWFQRQFDWDFVKLTPASNYCTADYGVQDRWVGSLEGTREYTRRVVFKTLDWTNIRPLDPNKGALGLQLNALGLLKEALSGEVPFLQTIFSPLVQAKHLLSGDLMLHMRTAPERLKTALSVLTESILRFIEAMRQIKPSGIFYAVQHASYALMTEAEYLEFGRPYDMQILEALPNEWWFNILHLHGEAPMFDLFADYPVQVINWHDRETAPDLAAGKLKFKGAVCGGLGRWDPVHNGSPVEVREMARNAIEQTNGRRFILSTGCVAMITSPLSNIRAVRQAVNNPLERA